MPNNTTPFQLGGVAWKSKPIMSLQSKINDKDPLLKREQFAVSLRKKKKTEILKLRRQRLTMGPKTHHENLVKQKEGRATTINNKFESKTDEPIADTNSESKYYRDCPLFGGPTENTVNGIVIMHAPNLLHLVNIKPQ